MAKRMKTAEYLNALQRNSAPGVPVVKWTIYGQWTEDGFYVLDNRGRIAYTHPLAPRLR